MSTSKAATSAASAIFTRVSSTVKDAALEAAKKARPQWHLIDAKDQASSSPLGPPLIPTLHVSLGVRGASHFYVYRLRVPSWASSEIWRARSPPCVSHVISSPPGLLFPVLSRYQVVGRLASQIASIIRGRHKPFYCPNADCGDYVVVVNARHVTLTGRKMKDKKYYWHTMHPGGLKSRTPEQLIERGQAEEILRHAVLGMLPKNKLRNHAIKKLRVFPEKYHIYEEQLRGKQSLL